MGYEMSMEYVIWNVYGVCDMKCVWICDMKCTWNMESEMQDVACICAL